jgi:hypothetical protein
LLNRVRHIHNDSTCRRNRGTYFTQPPLEDERVDDHEDPLLPVKLNSAKRLDDVSPIDVYKRWKTEELTIHTR